jgi:hypothetical protein
MGVVALGLKANAVIGDGDRYPAIDDFRANRELAAFPFGSKPVFEGIFDQQLQEERGDRLIEGRRMKCLSVSKRM